MEVGERNAGLKVRGPLDIVSVTREFFKMKNSKSKAFGGCTVRCKMEVALGKPTDPSCANIIWSLRSRTTLIW